MFELKLEEESKPLVTALVLSRVGCMVLVGHMIGWVSIILRLCSFQEELS